MARSGASDETPSPLPTRPDLAAMVDLCSSVSLRAQSECLTEGEGQTAEEVPQLDLLGRVHVMRT
jgi:hypothetical protein